MSLADVADAFEAGAWEFTPDVVADFDHHVRQSVPFYDVIQDTVAELADWLAPHGSTVADLGVSTAETCRRIYARHPGRNLRFVGYDNTSEMLRAALVKMPGMQTYLGNIEDGLHHKDAALTLMLFTLQFIRPSDRLLVLRMAWEAAGDTGAILLAEKVRVPDSRWHEIGAELSWDYKADNGISSESIRSKARALRGVLQPLPPEVTMAMMAEAGWVGATILFRWHQWCLIGAFKR